MNYNKCINKDNWQVSSVLFHLWLCIFQVAPFDKRDQADKKRKEYATGNSDHLTLLRAYKVKFAFCKPLCHNSKLDSHFLWKYKCCCFPGKSLPLLQFKAMFLGLAKVLSRNIEVFKANKFAEICMKWQNIC